MAAGAGADAHWTENLLDQHRRPFRCDGCIRAAGMVHALQKALYFATSV